VDESDIDKVLEKKYDVSVGSEGEKVVKSKKVDLDSDIRSGFSSEAEAEAFINMYRKVKTGKKRLRQIFPGVFVTGEDASTFIGDMMRMDSPIWRWITRISSMITPVICLAIWFKV